MESIVAKAKSAAMVGIGGAWHSNLVGGRSSGSIGDNCCGGNGPDICGLGSGFAKLTGFGILELNFGICFRVVWVSLQGIFSCAHGSAVPTEGAVPYVAVWVGVGACD